MTTTDSRASGDSVQNEGATGRDHSDLGPGFEWYDQISDKALRFGLMSRVSWLALLLLQGEWRDSARSDGCRAYGFIEPHFGDYNTTVLGQLRQFLREVIVLNARSGTWTGNPEPGWRFDASVNDVDFESLYGRLLDFALHVDNRTCEHGANDEVDDEQDVIHQLLKACFVNDGVFDDWARAQLLVVEGHLGRLTL